MPDVGNLTKIVQYVKLDFRYAGVGSCLRMRMKSRYFPVMHLASLSDGASSEMF